MRQKGRGGRMRERGVGVGVGGGRREEEGGGGRRRGAIWLPNCQGPTMRQGDMTVRKHGVGGRGAGWWGMGVGRRLVP